MSQTLQKKVAFHHHMTLHVLLEGNDIFYTLARAMQVVAFYTLLIYLSLVIIIIIIF